MVAPHLEVEAVERMREGGKKAGRGRPAEKDVETFPHPIEESASDPTNGKSRDEAGKAAPGKPAAKKGPETFPDLIEEDGERISTVPPVDWYIRTHNIRSR